MHGTTNRVFRFLPLSISGRETGAVTSVVSVDFDAGDDVDGVDADFGGAAVAVSRFPAGKGDGRPWMRPHRIRPTIQTHR